MRDAPFYSFQYQWFHIKLFYSNEFLQFYWCRISRGRKGFQYVVVMSQLSPVCIILTMFFLISRTVWYGYSKCNRTSTRHSTGAYWYFLYWGMSLFMCLKVLTIFFLRCFVLRFSIGVSSNLEVDFLKTFYLSIINFLTINWFFSGRVIRPKFRLFSGFCTTSRCSCFASSTFFLVFVWGIIIKLLRTYKTYSMNQFWNVKWRSWFFIWFFKLLGLEQARMGRASVPQLFYD